VINQQVKRIQRVFSIDCIKKQSNLNVKGTHFNNHLAHKPSSVKSKNVLLSHLSKDLLIQKGNMRAQDQEADPKHYISLMMNKS
jgi:hypothetical protein